MDVDSCLPELITNASRLLEIIIKNADTCRIFLERRVLRLLCNCFLCLSALIGESVSIALLNFSPQHSASLVRSVCSFLREHLKSTNDLLLGKQLASLEPVTLKTVLRHLFCLFGMLSLSIFLPYIQPEQGSSDAGILFDLGKTYKDIIWQLSMCNDTKMDEKRSNDCVDGLFQLFCGFDSIQAMRCWIVFFEAQRFSGHCTYGGSLSPSVLCRYLGKVVEITWGHSYSTADDDLATP